MGTGEDCLFTGIGGRNGGFSQWRLMHGPAAIPGIDMRNYVKVSIAEGPSVVAA